MEEGAIIIADHQTTGRGRLGRVWESSPGKSLLFSVLLFPELPKERIQLIGLMVSLGVLDGIREFVKQRGNVETVELKSLQNFRLKWPNDILWNGRKLCGILSEAGSTPSGRNFVVVGIGLNVNQSETDFSKEIYGIATSCSIIFRCRISRDGILNAILENIEKYYLRIKKDGSDWIPALWLSRSGALGQTVQVQQHEEIITGSVLGLEPDGALRLRLANSMEKVIYSGDVV